MNCQDITHIADTRSFSSLTAAERAAAEAHALTCRHCAPVWAAHARLAELRIPPMPAELALRCRTLAALPASAHGGRRMGRLTLVGGLVALAAAAGMLLMNGSNAPAPGTIATAAVTAAATNTAPVAVTPEIAAPAVAEAAPAPAPRAAAHTRLAPLPLIPAPVYDMPQTATVDLALQRAVERHPELVEGPEINGAFAVSIVLRDDGQVLNSMARRAASTSLADMRAADAEVARIVPVDGRGRLATSRDKGTRLPDGRTLRANVTMRMATVANAYDYGRSRALLQQIVKERYANLMRPAGGDEMNRLTIFLGEDGKIQREEIKLLRPEDMAAPENRPVRGDNPRDVTFLAENIAKRLGLDVVQIGLVGTAIVDDGAALLDDGNGNIRPQDKWGMVRVQYAWSRREGESAPTWGQTSTTTQAPGVDKAAALAIVEQQIPDAFRVKDPKAGTPTVVLTARGELIQAGRVLMKTGQPLDQLLNEQLLTNPRQTTSFTTVRLTNARGETADVQFAWEMPERIVPKPPN